MKLSKKVLNYNVYSVDMVRLRSRTNNDFVKNFFDKYSIESSVSYWESTKFNNYRHNWVFKSLDVFGKEVSFWVGYLFNSDKNNLSHWLVIEYNPNKNDIESGFLGDILKYFFDVGSVVEVVSADLACDMPCNIKSIYHNKGGKQVQKIFDYGGDNKTIYIGEGDGRVKIYNKARELGLKDKDLTRYEISLSLNNMPLRFAVHDISECIIIVPIYCIENYQFNMSLNGTDKALLYAVLNGYPIDDLTKDKRIKIKKILSESAGNTLERMGFAKAFNDYFKFYLSIMC